MKKSVLSLVLVSTFALVGGGAACSHDDDPAPPATDGTHDNHPGTLTITNPTRASFIQGDGAPVQVDGVGASTNFTIDGQPVDVAPDGSFHATVKPVSGLNIIVAADDDGRLETPFIYGHFNAASQAVPGAVSVDLAKEAIGGGSGVSGTTLNQILNRALAEKDLLAPVKGQTYTGSIPGGGWSFKVTGGKYAGAAVAIAPRGGGVSITATVTDVEVDGTLNIHELGVSVTNGVKITADHATVTGVMNLAVNDKGLVTAAMPDTNVSLQNFKYDSGNAGFPCCVDSAITGYIKPKVQSAIESGVHDNVPPAISKALSGISFPDSIDLSAIGVTDSKVPLDVKIDSVTFDERGGTVSAAVLFGGPFAAAAPGAKAPGWLTLEGSLPAATYVTPFGISVAVDAVNQLLFSAWGSGDIKVAVPDTPPLTGLTLEPALPPLVVPSDHGTLNVMLGEVVAHANLSGKPFTAAATLVDEVTLGMDGGALVLTPKGDPTIGITWLDADNVPDLTRGLILAGAKEELGKLLKPMRLPIPNISLDGIGPSFKGQSLALVSPQLSLDASNARARIAGTIDLLK